MAARAAILSGVCEIRCPAGTEVNPILSRNEADVQCGISGRLLPLADSPCVGDYSDCRIWQTARDLEGAPKSARDEVVEDPHKHVFRDDLPREAVSRA